MKIWLKRILIGLLAALVLALAGFAAFLLTFDPNAYKSKLESLVFEKFHRTLSIKGNVQLSLFPRIGLALQDVSLSDRDSTSTFASVDSARFAMAIWPLLSNSFVVDHVAVSGLKAWVVRDKQGKFNFQDLLGEAGPPAATPAGAPGTPVAGGRTEVTIDIAGLDLKDGEIHVKDEKQGYSLRVVKLQANTGRVTFDQPFDVTLRANLLGEQPEMDAAFEGQALLKMDSAQRSYAAQKLNLHVTGKLGAFAGKQVSLRGNLAYNASTRLLNASGLELQVQGDLQGDQPIKGLDASLTVPQMRVDSSRSEFNVEKLALRSKGSLPGEAFEVALDAPRLSISPESAKGEAVAASVKISGTNVLGLSLGASGLGGNSQQLTLKELKVEGGLKQGARAVRINLSSPAQWDTVKSIGILSAIKGDVKIESGAPSSGAFEFPLIGSIHADLAKDEVNGDVNAVLSGSPANLKFKVAKLSDPKVQLALQADTLDLDKLIPPTVPAKGPGPAAAPAAEKPAEKPVPEKPQAAASTAPASQQAAAQPAKAPEAKPAEPAKTERKAAEAPPAKPAAPTPAAAPAPADIDLAWLRPLDVSATAKIGLIKGRGLEASNASSSLRILGGKADISGLAADLYQGHLSGKLTATADNAFAIQLSLDGIQVGPLMHGLTGSDRISGKGGGKFSLTTQGTSVEALKSALAGAAQLQVRDGAVKGIDVEKTLGKVGSILTSLPEHTLPDLSGTFDLGSQTAFSSLDMAADIKAGVAQFKRLDLVSPALRVSEGSPATLDLPRNRIDLLVNAKVVNAGRAQEQGLLAELQGVNVPVLVSGPIEAPGYQIQWKDISGSLARQAVQKGLLNLLSKQLGGNEAGSAAGAPATGTRKPDPIQDLGNKLKGLLGK